MVIRDALKAAGCDRLDAEVLLAFVLHVSREKLFFLYDRPLSQTEETAFFDLVGKRLTGCPVAYLTNEKEFYSRTFFVTPDVLIPRPDTEILTEWGIGHGEGRRVLDLCCGSGCIGITVAAETRVFSLTLADISAPALSVAKQNAARHGVDASFLQLDILRDPLPGTFDLIVSNPPYVTETEYASLSPEVHDFEPSVALLGGEDGLCFYPVIIQKAFDALSENGLLGVEIGFRQGAAVRDMMAQRFADVRVLRDYSGHDRAVIGRKKTSPEI